MKHLAKYSAILLALVVLSSYILNESAAPAATPTSVDEEPDRNRVLMEVIMGSLERRHFNPQDIDDSYSKKAFNLYMERLDRNKRYLIAGDVEQLKAYETRIDDEINNKRYQFFDMSEKLITKRMDATKKIYEEVLGEPFDFTVDESIETEPENLTYAKDEKELRERWRKVLKYQTLARLHGMVKDQKAAVEKDADYDALTMEELEAKAREKILKNYDRWYKRLQKVNTNDRLTVYINSILNIYGPHTSWFPPKSKEDFDINMSGRLEGIGAQLVERDGNIKVTRIVPGSASARQGELKAGDIITKVAQAEEEPVDVVDMRLDEAVKLIRGKKGTEVRLTVQKKDGTTTVIAIIRDVVVIEETYAKSAVIQNEANNNPVGYIYLPKFYADFQKANGRHCSEDVRKEIEKLKEEGISGIVLDLRDNGGGSLQDAIDMAGLFIEKGPVVQVKAKGRQPAVYRDRDPKVHYDGPLVIMTNSSSASASEILAAAMQDYDRGVIVGSSSSFGKGTVQRFYGLDDVLPAELGSIKPLGAVKITTQKFYRINGGATQLRGVTPDIVLPDLYQYIESGEKEQDFVMPWDEIQPVDYERWANKPNLDQLRSNSKKRVASNAVFREVESHAKRLKNQDKESIYSLNYDKYTAMRAEREAKNDEFEELDKEIADLKVRNLKVDMDHIEADTSRASRNEDWLEALNKDQYLNESLYIISDMSGR